MKKKFDIDRESMWQKLEQDQRMPSDTSPKGRGVKRWMFMVGSIVTLLLAGLMICDFCNGFDDNQLSDAKAKQDSHWPHSTDKVANTGSQGLTGTKSESSDKLNEDNPARKSTSILTKSTSTIDNSSVVEKEGQVRYRETKNSRKAQTSTENGLSSRSDETKHSTDFLPSEKALKRSRYIGENRARDEIVSVTNNLVHQTDSSVATDRSQNEVEVPTEITSKNSHDRSERSLVDQNFNAASNSINPTKTAPSLNSSDQLVKAVSDEQVDTGSKVESVLDEDRTSLVSDGQDSSVIKSKEYDNVEQLRLELRFLNFERKNVALASVGSPTDSKEIDQDVTSPYSAFVSVSRGTARSQIEDLRPGMSNGVTPMVTARMSSYQAEVVVSRDFNKFSLSLGFGVDLHQLEQLTNRLDTVYETLPDLNTFSRTQVENNFRLYPKYGSLFFASSLSYQIQLGLVTLRPHLGLKYNAINISSGRYLQDDSNEPLVIKAQGKIDTPLSATFGIAADVRIKPRVAIMLGIKSETTNRYKYDRSFVQSISPVYGSIGLRLGL